MSYSNPVAYDRFMGRWSARLAPAFLRFTELRDGQHVLDLGCGTGSLSRAVISFGPATRITGLDPQPEYVSFAQEAVPDPRARFQVGAAEALPFADRTFDGALALLVLQDFSDPLKALSEMARVTQTGGVVAACLWDFEAGLPMLSLVWQAAEAVAPEAVAKRRMENAPVRRATMPELRALWESCDLSDVRSTTLELAMHYTSFEDYWRPFLGGSTPMSAFAAALDAETQGGLARVLKEKIPGVQPGSSFVLPARAWAIKGTTRP
jgi:SAM-dependent methyltransferase